MHAYDLILTLAGGLAGLKARSDANAAALDKIVSERSWLGHLAADPASRSKTSVCLTVEGADADFIKAFAGLLDGLAKGAFPGNGPILFLHTGGAPALFAYHPEAI